MKLACESHKGTSEADLELITAVLLVFTEQSMVASGAERKVDSITPGAVLLRDGISLPGRPPLPSERYGSWYKLRELNGHDVEELALEAGWRFTFIATTLQVTAFGLTRQAAIYRAAVKAIHEVTSRGFAAFEVGSVDVQHLMGIYRAKLLVHVRQPRPSPYLRELDPYCYSHQFEDFDGIFWRASQVQPQFKGL